MAGVFLANLFKFHVSSPENTFLVTKQGLTAPPKCNILVKGGMDTGIRPSRTPQEGIYETPWMRSDISKPSVVSDIPKPEGW
ncbi:hypothetical protein JCM33374_g6192 [Metschnikowia sp. JCM 33374]|nr:hypothetical protein JCM33374_g6192 [Metschnikowia sp. JCM 33374]